MLQIVEKRMLRKEMSILLKFIAKKLLSYTANL